MGLLPYRLALLLSTRSLVLQREVPKSGPWKVFLGAPAAAAVVFGGPEKTGGARTRDRFTCPPGKVGGLSHTLKLKLRRSTTYCVLASSATAAVAEVSTDARVTNVKRSEALRTAISYTRASATAVQDALTELVVLDPEIAVVVGKNLLASTSTATLYNFPSTVASTVYLPDTARQSNIRTPSHPVVPVPKSQKSHQPPVRPSSHSFRSVSGCPLFQPAGPLTTTSIPRREQGSSAGRRKRRTFQTRC